MPYTLFGILMIGMGIWHPRTPRQSKIGLFLGPMIRYRIFGIILIALGALTLSVGLGLRSTGSIPIIVN